MFSSHGGGTEMSWKSLLQKETWEEGRVIHLSASSYRHRVAVVCFGLGRQTAEFVNGPGNFGAYIELVRADGSWIAEGNNIVPVLRDGRLLMIVEQRPAQYAWKTKPPLALIGGDKIDLGKFGPYSSLEFPGGAVDAGENFQSGFVRELSDETGIEDQTADLLMRRAMDPSGADCSLQQRLGVIYLKGVGFENFTRGDGGLYVFALTPEEVQENIWRGAITSGQAAIFGWAFYNEVHLALKAGTIKRLKEIGYITRQEVTIKKS
jgi:8-oxo-dGTP pyrophosphatase MutT (NUDIX family)